LLASIRAHALAWRKVAKHRSPGGAEAPAPEPESGGDWLAVVGHSVAAIPPDAPQRNRRAFRVYLKALLARECGVREVTHPEFESLVDQVLETMEANSRLKDAMAAAGELLLQSAGAEP